MNRCEELHGGGWRRTQLRGSAAIAEGVDSETRCSAERDGSRVLIHHFYPRTKNIGDHFVREGIEVLFREIAPSVVFKSFDVNGKGKTPRHRSGAYGLVSGTIERANREADVVIVGGSNLYEGHATWGVHCDLRALPKLEKPLLLVGIGTGSAFGASSPTRPSPEVLAEIKAVNAKATFSGVRDTVTLRWLADFGISTHLMGDPAAYTFDEDFTPASRSGPILIVPPNTRTVRPGPRRSIRKLFRFRDKSVFTALRETVTHLQRSGEDVVVVLNDPDDIDYVETLFGVDRTQIARPVDVGSYVQLMRSASFLCSGRLHSCVLALALGVPFALLDMDQRTRGFIDTYGVGASAIPAFSDGVAQRMLQAVEGLRPGGAMSDWQDIAAKRRQMKRRAVTLLREALAL